MLMNSFDDSMLIRRNADRHLGERAAPHLALWVRTAALALVVAVPLVINPWAADAYVAPKVLVIYGLAVAMVLGWVAAYAVARRPRWRATRPETAVWLFLLGMLISSWASVNPRLTFFGAPGRYEGLLALLAYVVFYFIGVHFFGSERGFQTIAGAAVAAAMVVIGYGIVQTFISPLFPAEAVIKSSYALLGYPRSTSTFGNPVVFGGYLALITPLLLGFALSAKGRGRVFWSVAAGLGYVVTLMTLTRAAWLAVAAGTAIPMIALGREALRRHWTALAALLAVVVIGVAVTLAMATPEKLAGRAASAFAVRSGSVGERVYIWDRTIALIRSRPLLGWGLETLREVFPYDRQTLVRYFGFRPVIVDEAHNDLLQMAVSVGIPGAVAYLAFWVLVIVAAVRTWRHASGTGRILAAGWLAAVIAYMVQAQFSFSTVAVAPVMWLLAGAAGGWEAVGRGE